MDIDTTAPAAATSPVPCAARPGWPVAHTDGPCHCFAGGPAPHYVDVARPGRFGG